MKQLLLQLLRCSSSILFFLLCGSTVFSQSIDLGNVGLIKNKCVDEQKKELYVFYTDSVVVFDLVKLVKKSSNKLEFKEDSDKEILYGETVCINSKIYFINLTGGIVFSLKNNEFVRIDKSFNHKMQISSSIFPYNDTIYRYGGYGFWSNRNFFTYFDKSNSEWEVVSPTGSKELPKGSQESIVTIIEDDIFVYGGFRVQEFEPINHTINDEVWKFNTTSKSWKKLGNTDFDLNNQTLKFSYHDKNGFFSNLNGELLVVDVLNNKKTFYKKTLFHKDIIFSPFFIDGVFYCFNWKSYNTNKSEIVLVTRNEDEFFGEFVREEKFYSNNENIYLSVGFIVLSILMVIIIFQLYKWNRRRNRIIVVNGHLVYKRRILNFDDKSTQIINLLLKSKKEVNSKEILKITENPDFNYGHNTRVMNLLLDEINFKLKETLRIEKELISYKKSDLDKRIKVYSIDKSLFFIK